MNSKIDHAYKAYKWIMAAPPGKKAGRPLGLIKRVCLYAPAAFKITLRYPQTSRKTAMQTPYNFQLTNFEKELPLRPKSVWLYCSFLLYFIPTFFLLKDRKTIEKGLLGMEALVNISHEIYQQYPGRYPFGPKEAHLSWWKPADLALRLYYAVDPKRNNVFPSLHVGMTAFVGLTLLHGGYARAARFMLLWSTLLSASTLPVKQHFQVDIIAAWVLASKAHNCFLETEQRNEAAMAEIKDATLRVSKNLITGNFSPSTEERAFPYDHIHPAILEVAEKIGELNPFDLNYSEIIKRTLDLAKTT